MRNSNSLIGFRVDASDSIGFGHVVRCLALAEYMLDYGHDVVFITRDLDKVKRATGDRYTIMEIENDSADSILSKVHPRVMVIDLREGGEQLSEELISRVSNVVLISDFPRYVPPLIDIYCFPTFIPLDIEIPASVKVFGGGKYILLRREIINYIGRSSEVRKDVENITVILGGGYRKRDEMEVLNTLDNINYRGEVNLFSGIFSIKGGLYDFRLKVVKGFKIPYKEISQSDLVICGSGLSLFETLALKKPAISIPGSRREEEEVNVLSEMGYCFDGRGDIRHVLCEAIECFESRKKIVRNIEGAVDGKGAERVAKAIDELVGE
ncbi:MAG: hypothetical protein DRH44_03120 [Candidatus Coatesbacteria bacterium]|nr:MAG: hypothetical protein DRH44_03120 [Candidatus Coatesbacteria bacterium]